MSCDTVSDEDLLVLGELLRRDVVGVQYIRDEIGHDHSALMSCFSRLRGLGCEIEKTGPADYRLIRTGLGAWEDFLSYSLKFSSLWVDQISVYRQTASTQDVAKSLAPIQAIVLADQQSAGRGRLGRQWLSHPGACVLMSVSKRITGGHGNHDRLSMLVGVAIARAIVKICPDAPVQLKWPNDVIVQGRKLAGVLIEAASGMHVIGIGMNVSRQAEANPEFSSIAISLEEIGRPVDRLYVIDAVLHQLGNVLRSQDVGSLLDEWRSRASLGQTQTFEQAGQRITGTVMDLDPDHGLIVRRDTGEIVTLPAATTSVVL